MVRGEVSAELAQRFAGRAVVSLRSALAADAPFLAAHQRHVNDVAYMFYSGGTTGTAKGITHLAHDFVLIPERQGAFWEYSADGRGLRDLEEVLHPRPVAGGADPALLGRDLRAGAAPADAGGGA